MNMSLKEKAREIKKNISALFIALKKKETPLYAKVVIAITVAYALSPVDLVPDFIPVLGYLDDLIILPLLAALSIKLIPKEIMETCRLEAEGLWKDGKPKKWYYGIPVIIIWIVVVFILIWKIVNSIRR